MLAASRVAASPLPAVIAKTAMPHLSLMLARSAVRQIRHIATRSAPRKAQSAARYFPQNTMLTPARGFRSESSQGRSGRHDGSSSSSGFEIPNGYGDVQIPSAPVIAATVMAGGGLILARNSVLMTDAGMTYVVQNNLTGALDVHMDPGIHYRVPFFSTVTTYKQVITASFEDQSAVTARFADTYVGMIPVTFRFKLPRHADGIRKMHREFRSEDNLVQSLLMRNAANVTVITATQYTGEEFFQGGLNQYKTQLADQLQNGIYLTERKQVEVEQTDLAPVGADQDSSNKRGQLVKAKQLVWKTVPIVDGNGMPKRAENPLSQYGIDVTQVLIGDPRPEQNLDRLLMDKKRLVAERIKTVQEQETSKAQAKTEQLKKEIERTKAVQDAQREKELVVIKNQREVEVAKQIAERETIEQRKLQDLAVIQKDKELAVARAGLDIQKANAQAAKFEAEAIASKGKAEAEVLSAMYKAKSQNKEIFLAETQRDMAQALYGNLKDFKVEMPQNVILGAGGPGAGGAGKMPSNLDVITGFSALGLMEKALGHKVQSMQ